MMHRYAVIASAFASLGVVSGHGGGMHYIIDGVTHKGAIIVGERDETVNTEPSIQRLWTWSTAMGPRDPDMTCGPLGTPLAKSYHAPIVAGSTISVNYTGAAGSINPSTGHPYTFGHPYGSMMAYMAACPDEGCEGVELKAPIWFKVWDRGLISGTWVEGRWGMTDVYEGANLNISTPTSLKPGKYLLRHEMLNLQTGPPQWFVNCIQLDVSGDGSGLPSDDELVSFPKAYEKDADKSYATKDGTTWFYVNNANSTFYPMPGPAVWEG
jgi:cellulase